MTAQPQDDLHVCFACNRQIGDGEPHIHVGLDEWAIRNGQEPLGLDDLLTFPFCGPCTEETDDGWQLEAHEIAHDGGSQ
jgi:hypothetical protein